jgi:hypothetical protein
MNELTDEKIIIGRALEEAKEIMKNNDEEIAVLRSTVAELTQQLSNSQSKREESVYRAAR